MQSYCADGNLNLKLRVRSDLSAARSLGSVANEVNHLSLVHEDGKHILADMMTKTLSRAEIIRHFGRLAVCDRSASESSAKLDAKT